MSKAVKIIGVATILAAVSSVSGIPAAQAEPAASVVGEMPDVVDMVLVEATDTIREDLPDIPLWVIDHVNRQDQLNPTGWIVCAQYPDAGEEVPADIEAVAIYVRRYSTERCWKN